MDHSSHPYGFNQNINNWKGEEQLSNYLMVETSRNFDKNLQYSHLHLKNESLPFAPNQKLSGNIIRVTSVSSHFQVLAPHGRCCHPGDDSKSNGGDESCKERTSETAKESECIVATNAGFFDVANGYCLGRVVSNGKELNNYGRIHPNAAFGLIDDGKGNSRYVYGYLNETDYEKLKITQLIQGVVWLVREGKSYINESVKIEKTSTSFIEEAAPRVAIGNDASGNLLILQMDGYEPLKWGLSLYQFTDLLLSLGFKNAINVDGGGSATTYIKDHDKLFVSII